MQACGSEVVSMREEIAHEYMAARLGLYGLRFGISQQKVMTVYKEWIHDALLAGKPVPVHYALSILTALSEHMGQPIAFRVVQWI
jgi:hypothetical protein